MRILMQFVFSILFLAGCEAKDVGKSNEFATNPREIVCTTDVRECPDGTYVARDPAKTCEFKPCKGEEKSPRVERESSGKK